MRPRGLRMPTGRKETTTMPTADNPEVETGFFARLVTLAGSLVTGFDPVDLADHLVGSSLDFLPAVSAGIMLDDQRGHLRVLASSSEETRLLELFELQNNE